MHFKISGECLIPNHFWVFVILWDNPFKAKPCCIRLFLSSFPAASLRETEKFLPRLLHTLLQRLKIPEDFEPAQNSGFQTLPRLQESCRKKHCKVIQHNQKYFHRFEIEQNNINLAICTFRHLSIFLALNCFLDNTDVVLTVFLQLLLQQKTNGLVWLQTIWRTRDSIAKTSSETIDK